MLQLIVLTCYANLLNSQNEPRFSSQRIQELINKDSIVTAENELKQQTDYYSNTKQYDSLSKLIYYVGKLAHLNGDENFLKTSEAELDKLLSQTNSAIVRYNAYSDLASLSAETSYFKESYNYNKLGLEVAKDVEEDRLNKMALRTYGLASTAYFMRKLDLVKKHGIEAFKINESNPEATATNIYSACNVVGLMMQNENKLDSALYYYNKGVKALEGSSGGLSERYYYPAVLGGNMAIIYMNQGKYRASLKSQRDAIANYKIFIDSSSNNPNIIGIRYNYLSTINDMGSNYVKLGEVERALQLFEYNYNKAKEYFPENSIQELIFTNQYAQGKWVANDSEEALELINEAYNKFTNLSSDYAGYMTYSMGTKANILENMGSINDARAAFKLSDSLYEIVNPGNYSFDRLTKLREAALFYSRNGFIDDANSSSKKILDLAKSEENENDTDLIKAFSLMAEVKFNQKQYQESIDWANRCLKAIEDRSNSTDLDQAFWGNLKFQPQFIKTQARYYTIDTFDIASLTAIYKELNKTINSLNENASKYTSELDKNQYIYNTLPKLDFAMRIGLKLYDLTKEERYLNEVISIHESRIYNRIRAKLGNQEEINFYDIPKVIAQRERQLKDSLATLRSNTVINTETLNAFSTKNEEWVLFLDSLKTNYPKYYEMRYGTINLSLLNLKKNIPKNTTVVRYFFNDKTLYALIARIDGMTLHRLNSDNLSDTISSLSSYTLNESETCKQLHNLYKTLWEPISSKVTSKKVIIIPDKDLFNLSFESLSTKAVTSYSDLIENSLLNSHTFSYNYSLQLVDKSKKVVNYDKDFIAFAPEFNDEMKSNYRIAVSDSFALDRTYLKLLPQPFTSELAKEYSRVFNGESFINENASKDLFVENAKEHKIIHIGTHAESNNVSPELSRLIFAKKTTDEDNSLYTYEIYNQNLASNLAILTACETGKPTYQPGEGMISLAHAFNYAGSESILTSLWKIDEQSSAIILKDFYENLSNGLSKDEALKEAKKNYIATAKGRTLSPQYWAGLVLIGDITPIEIVTNSNLNILLGIGILILIAIFILLRIRKK